VNLDYGLPVHPVCDLFPMMDAHSLAGLTADVKSSGLLSAIVLHEGQIVDGRNRLLACREAGVEPRFVEWRQTYTGTMAIDCWIWSLNVERRHLTPDQIAWAVVQRRAWQERQAAMAREKSGKSADGTAGGRGHKKNPPVEPPEGSLAPTGETREVLAREAGTSTNKIRQALAVQKLAGQDKVAPELAEQLKNGTVKLHDVIKRAEAASAPAPPPVPVPEPSPAAAKDDAVRTKRQQAIDAAAKRRMVEALSQLRGACRGLSELNVIAVRRACTAEETDTWATIARNAAKELRLFSSKLESTREEDQ
jgi:hypothetical protein